MTQQDKIKYCKIINESDTKFMADPYERHQILVRHPDGWSERYSYFDEDCLKEVYDDWNRENVPDCDCEWVGDHHTSSVCEIIQDDCPVNKIVYPRCTCEDIFLKEK